MCEFRRWPIQENVGTVRATVVAQEQALFAHRLDFIVGSICVITSRALVRGGTYSFVKMSVEDVINRQRHQWRRRQRSSSEKIHRTTFSQPGNKKMHSTVFIVGENVNQFQQFCVAEQHKSCFTNDRKTISAGSVVIMK